MTQPLIRIWSPDPEDEEGCSREPPADGAQKPRAVCAPDDATPALREAAGKRDDGGMAVTVAVLVASYLRHLEARLAGDDLSEVSLTASRRDLARFVAIHGHKLASECRSADLTEFILGNPKWKSNATKRRVMAEVLACFTWAVTEAGLLESTQLRRPRRLRLPVKKRREAQPHEYIAVMRAGNRELRLAMFFLRRNPSRTCEMREARWPDVDFEAGIISLWRHKTHRATGEPRLVGIETCTLRLLRNLYRQASDKAGHIFTNHRGQQWSANAFAQHLRRTLQRMGMDPGAGNRLTAYMLRHSWSGNASERGLSDRQIADGLGHANTDLVSWYSKARERKGYLRSVAEEAVKRDRKPRRP